VRNAAKLWFLLVVPLTTPLPDLAGSVDGVRGAPNHSDSCGIACRQDGSNQNGASSGSPENERGPRSMKDGPLLLVHYMPWYVAQPFRPIWGWHWTMNAFDPERVTSGKREIASHYYPLIGPYDSGNPVVLEYHLLLMKLSGIDGVIVDWYGLAEHWDYAILHRNTDLLIQKASHLGLKFAICYEDQTIPRLVEAKKLVPADRVKHARREIEWLRGNWFGEPGYVRIDGKPLFLSFGYDGLTDAEWVEAFRDMEQAPLYVSEHRRRLGAAGSFDWPIPTDYPGSVNRFYDQLSDHKHSIPVAFPRFHDIYAEGKARASLGRIDDDDGRTWDSTLRKALRSGAPAVQLATWNDWGEGTGIEPTEEFGYRDLDVVQTLRRELTQWNSARSPADLRLPLRLFKLRRTLADSPERSRELDRIAGLLSNGSIREAAEQLDHLENL
jgi:hypothetical protein